MSNKLEFKPRPVGEAIILPDSPIAKSREIDKSTLAVADKLSRHLGIIKDYKDRIDAVDYLIEGAEKLSGSPSFKVNRPDIQLSVSRMGGSEEIDFQLFKKCVERITEEYKRIAIFSLVDVSDPDVLEKIDSGEFAKNATTK